jgi:hypothetical protein
MASIPQINQWFRRKEWKVFPFQQNCWEAIAEVLGVMEIVKSQLIEEHK